MTRFTLAVHGNINKQRFSGLITLPNRLRRDFLHPDFNVDGDGCIRLTYRNGANGNKLYHAHLDICGTPEFLEGMLDRTGWDRTQIHHDKRSNACGVGWMGSIKCVKYLHQLYNDATIYLDRKYELYLEIIAVLGGNI